MSKLLEKEILKYISDKQDFVTVSDIKNHFKVSRLTAYTTLRIMSAKGLLIARKIGNTYIYEVNKANLELT